MTSYQTRKITIHYEADIPTAIAAAHAIVGGESSGNYLHVRADPTELRAHLGPRYTVTVTGYPGYLALVRAVLEPDVTVEVEQQDRFAAVVLDDLDALGVPADEQPGVRERAIEQFWAAEHSAWLQSPEGEASGQ